MDNNTVKRIAVIVHAPLGVFGDISGAKRLADCLMNSIYDIKIDFIVFVEEQDKEKIKNFNDPEFDSFKTICLKPQQTHAPKRLREVDSILNQVDAILVFGTYRFLINSQDISSLARYNKPTLFLSDYDRQMTALRTDTTKHFPIGFVNVGLSPQCLGIFIPQLPKVIHQERPLLSIQNQELSLVRYLLELSEQDSKTKQIEKYDQYFKNRDLYLGYFNQIKQSGQFSKKTIAYPVLFIEDCLEITANNSKKKLDIIIPLLTEVTDKTKGRNTQDVTDYFSQKYTESELSIVHCFKDEQENWVEQKLYGHGPYQIRLINGFPMLPENFQIFLKVSSPFCLLTGNQSLIEGIMHEKCSMNQVMFWNTKCYFDLRNSVKQYIGSTSLYAAYLEIQSMRESENKLRQNKKLVHLYIKFQKELQAEIRQFKQYLIEERNLDQSLPNIVMNCCFNPEKHIKICLNSCEQCSFLYLLKLGSWYPHQLDFILRHSLENNIFHPFMLFENLSKIEQNDRNYNSIESNAYNQYEITIFTRMFESVLLKFPEVDQILTDNFQRFLLLASTDQDILKKINVFAFYITSQEGYFEKFYPKFFQFLNNIRSSNQQQVV